MSSVNDPKACRRCGETIEGKYCSNCGEAVTAKRITIHNLLHDVFHFFTHLDKGFGFTVKQLLLSPGTMQRRFIEGDRSRYQKPFSMFFICATIDAVLRYWILTALEKYYHTGDEAQTHFFHQYLVLTHILMMPVYVFIAWLVFYNRKYNYAEIGVLVLYNTSFFFLIAAALFIPKLVWHDYDTAWSELAVIAIYNAVTFINFYKEENKWIIIIKSVVAVTLTFVLANYVEDILTKLLGN
ncbi:MAG: DUF3667 domain-containing protein [Chitinophagaceae bacterium]